MAFFMHREGLHVFSGYIHHAAAHAADPLSAFYADTIDAADAADNRYDLEAWVEYPNLPWYGLWTLWEVVPARMTLARGARLDDAIQYEWANMLVELAPWRSRFEWWFGRWQPQ